jgi:surface polysaccharide O-acyltransferase-like enzyme
MIFNMNVAFILNQAARFAVPLFILLSGASLGLSGSVHGIERFYKRRLLKIGIPYIFWVTVYFLYNNRSDFGAITIKSLLRALILGQAAPHLYFIIVILQLYLLYPFLKKVAAKSPWNCLLVSFMISYAIQKLFSFLKFDVDLIPKFIRPYLWMLFPTWLFYFVAGMVLTRDRLFYVQKLAEQNAAAIIMITVAFSSFYVLESEISDSIDSIKAPLNLYTVLILFCLFAVWKYIGKLPVIQKMTGFLAKHSMTIYFEHVLVLYFFRRVYFFRRGMSGMILLYIAVVVVAVFVAVLIDNVTKFLSRGVFRRKVALAQENLWTKAR